MISFGFQLRREVYLCALVPIQIMPIIEFENEHVVDLRRGPYLAIKAEDQKQEEC